MKNEVKNVIFEITVENIPSRFVIPAKEKLKETVESLLKEKHLSFSNIKVYATYRRFVVFIKDVPSKTEKIIEKIYGPKASLLKDEKGNYTPQAIGFARSCGVEPQSLSVEKHEKKGEVICAFRIKPSVSCLKVLAEVFEESIKRLEFPKNMIWEESRFRFARPIRNIVALWGSRVIPISLCGVKSTKITYSSYFTGFKKININSADSYFNILEKNYVIVDDEKRKKIIMDELDGIEKKLNCRSLRDESLVNENVYLSEYPRSVVVKYPSEFLKLPLPLLELVIKKQLKFFPLTSEDGSLIPFFVGIRDGISKGQSNVENGYLNVMKARCADALFFYETDLKTDPSLWREKIKNIVFQGDMGSVYDKSLRVKKLTEKIVEELKLGTDAVKVAEYIYYDLASNVVGEFSELEGIMNYYYAGNYGIKEEELKKAISEIYLPVSLSSPLPSNIYSSVIAIAHKIDTLTGDFLTDMIPTGSNDPHGLRRAAGGVFRIILENELKLSVKKLIKYSYDIYPDNIRNRKACETLINSILSFIYQRAFSYFEEKGYSTDVLQSVESVFVKEGDPLKFKKRIYAISSMREQDAFKKLVVIYKRLKNIAGNYSSFEIDKTLFCCDEERKVYEIAVNIENKLCEYMDNGDFVNAFNEILKLGDPLENFFNKVLVMVDDEKIRNNRLSLLRKVYSFFDNLADFSRIIV